MRSLSFVIPGEVSLQVTLTEQANGSLLFALANQGDTAADLRGFFFDTTASSLLSTLTVSGDAITAFQFKDDAVRNLGNGVNMNGHGSFDAGIAFGTAGIGADDIDSLTFTLSSSRAALRLEDFAGVDFGVRYTSVGDEGGSRNGSLKLVTESPDAPPPPPPPPPSGGWWYDTGEGLIWVPMPDGPLL